MAPVGKTLFLEASSDVVLEQCGAVAMACKCLYHTHTSTHTRIRTHTLQNYPTTCAFYFHTRAVNVKYHPHTRISACPSARPFSHECDSSHCCCVPHSLTHPPCVDFGDAADKLIKIFLCFCHQPVGLIPGPARVENTDKTRPDQTRPEQKLHARKERWGHREIFTGRDSASRPGNQPAS